MISRDHVQAWLDSLKQAWEAGDGRKAVELFAHTEEYYERPFRPGTTAEEIKSYWRDIDGLTGIRFEYEIVAVEGTTACVHWQNWFSVPGGSDVQHLDGVFVIEFDAAGRCKVFRQWWFLES